MEFDVWLVFGYFGVCDDGCFFFFVEVGEWVFVVFVGVVEY